MAHPAPPTAACLPRARCRHPWPERLPPPAARPLPHAPDRQLPAVAGAGAADRGRVPRHRRAGDAGGCRRVACVLGLGRGQGMPLAQLCRQRPARSRSAARRSERAQPALGVDIPCARSPPSTGRDRGGGHHLHPRGRLPLQGPRHPGGPPPRARRGRPLPLCARGAGTRVRSGGFGAAGALPPRGGAAGAWWFGGSGGACTWRGAALHSISCMHACLPAQVVSGNYVTAKRRGIVNGIDFGGRAGVGWREKREAVCVFECVGEQRCDPGAPAPARATPAAPRAAAPRHPAGAALSSPAASRPRAPARAAPQAAWARCGSCSGRPSSSSWARATWCCSPTSACPPAASCSTATASTCVGGVGRPPRGLLAAGWAGPRVWTTAASLPAASRPAPPAPAGLPTCLRAPLPPTAPPHRGSRPPIHRRTGGHARGGGAAGGQAAGDHRGGRAGAGPAALPAPGACCRAAHACLARMLRCWALALGRGAPAFSRAAPCVPHVPAPLITAHRHAKPPPRSAGRRRGVDHIPWPTRPSFPAPRNAPRRTMRKR